MTAISVQYDAPPTLSAFMESDDPVRGCVGPFGSGKSSACNIEILRRAMEQRPGPDGIRHSRWAVVRNTYRELQDTTRKTFEQWIPDALGKWYEQEFIFELAFTPKDGVPVHAEVMFRALDRPEDVKKLLSLELTGAYINEFREIAKAIFEGLTGRVGRYPAKKDGGATWDGIWFDTNPWHATHWAAKLFAENHPGYSLFRQPGGRSAGAENLGNLRDGYYERLAVGKDSEWIRVYVDGEDASGAVGAIFGAWIAKLRARGAIAAFDHPTDKVFTAWDLGKADSTAIWFWRTGRHGVPDVIDHYEASGQGLSHYFGVVDAKGYDYAGHWLPHDASNETLATQTTVFDQCEERWPGKVFGVPRVGIDDGIAAARWLLEQPIRIHERCGLDHAIGHSGIGALEGYRFKWNPDLSTFSGEPVHDWASHSGDAWRYFALVAKHTAQLVAPPTKPPPPKFKTFADLTMDDLWKSAPKRRRA